MEKNLKIEKITDKVEGLDVRGQGCLDDCAEGYWSGNASTSQSGCSYIATAPTARTTTLW